VPSGFSITGTSDGGVPSYLMPSSIISNDPIFIRAQINNVYRQIILDTGSGTTIIHHRFLKQIQHDGFRPIPSSYSSANGTTLAILGEVDLNIKINNILTTITAAVATCLVTDLLLGTDWINKYVTSLDIINQTLNIHDTHGQCTNTPLIRLFNSSTSSPVTLSNSVTIPKHSTCTVSVKIPSVNNAMACFESSSKLNTKPFFIPDALINIKNHQSIISITNYTDHSYTVPHNTCIGTVSTSSIICTMCSSISSASHSSSDTSNFNSCSTYTCYVCHDVFLTNNDLHRHLREKCYPVELRHQINTLTSHITDSTHRTHIQDLLWEYGKLFDIRNPSKINFTLEHAIDTGQNRPVYTTPYRRSPKDHEILTEQTLKLLNQNTIESSTSPWCSPVVLVKKKDGGTRFCVDYRKLNDITVKDSFPLPRIDDIFDQLSQSIYFTKLDFKNGYFQIPLAPADRPKTAFSTRDNHYQFTVLPQGVKNGPPTFQRIVNQILGPARWKYCLAYIDDILIFSQTLDDHILHLNEVFQLLHSFNFRLSVEKCTIAAEHIDYLGHHIHRGQIRPSIDNVRDLLESPVPSTPQEIFRFVKAAEYFRKFIPNFSRLAAPLYQYSPSSNNLTTVSSSIPLTLSPTEQAAYDQLKHILSTDLVLQLPNYDLPFKIQTDASQIGIGAVLLQTYSEGDRPVCYLSKKFSPTQQRWAVIEQECYAIVVAIEQWRHYLHGRHFTIESDHKPLESFTIKSQLNDKCERWRLKLQSYDFTVRHISGASNTMADFLSRSPANSTVPDLDSDIQPTFISTATQTDNNFFLNPSISPSINMVVTRSRAKQSLVSTSDNNTSTTPTSNSSIDSSIPTSFSTSNDLRINFTGDLSILKDAQQLDPTTKHIIRNLHTSQYANSYLLSDGLLMHKHFNYKPVPYVPPGPIRNDIMKIYHDTPANGAHFGRDKTIHKIKTRYYWNTMRSDITNYIKSCFRCNQNNPVRRKPPGHLKPIEPPEGVWQLLAMDFHGPISPISQRGNKYIISLTDVLSKFVIAKAVRDCTADTAARFIQEEVICKYGTPKCILTDNGTHFTSNMMNQLFKRLGIVHLFSTPYHPQTNGQIERFNSTMDSKIASLSNSSRSDWDNQLPYVIFNYNTSSHSTTNTIPFELMYGRSPVLPCDPQDPMVSLQIDSQHVTKLHQHISYLTTTAQHHLRSAQKTYKTRFDAHRSNPSYAINDLVLIKTFKPRHKFDIRHEGPYRIIQRLTDKTYILQHVHLHHLTRQVTVDSIVPLISRSPST
jgi:transposase InsO family protein